MVNQMTKPQTTSNYSMFKFKHGNRPVDQAHVKKLITSMTEVYVPQTIYVNKRYEITDGQHRFTAAKALGLPITYMVTDHSLDDIRRMNQNNKNWSIDDFLSSYVSIEAKKNPETVGPYGVFKHFKEITGFGNATCIMMLSNEASSAIGLVHSNVIKAFKNGEFVIPPGQFEKAKRQAKMINLVGHFYEGNKRRSFIAAFIQALNDEKFDFKKFIRKLELNRSKLFHCTSTDEYLEAIQKLYNWGDKKKTKLRR